MNFDVASNRSLEIKNKIKKNFHLGEQRRKRMKTKYRSVSSTLKDLTIDKLSIISHFLITSCLICQLPFANKKKTLQNQSWADKIDTAAFIY